VCDLETSRIGAPYICGISNLRIKEQMGLCHWIGVQILAVDSGMKVSK
jgi:hypothetical protein